MCTLPSVLFKLSFFRPTSHSFRSVLGQGILHQWEIHYVAIERLGTQDPDETYKVAHGHSLSLSIQH